MNNLKHTTRRMELECLKARERAKVVLQFLESNSKMKLLRE